VEVARVVKLEKRLSQSETMPTFKGDYEFGTKEEEEKKGLLEKVFGVTLIRRGGSSVLDYDDGNTFYLELKSRRITHNKYPTAILGANKVKYAEGKDKVWFCWNYTDGIYGLKYDKELFDTFTCGDYERGARADFHNRPQEVYFIPHRHLTKLA
jgi:hypothetical protein